MYSCFVVVEWQQQKLLIYSKRIYQNYISNLLFHIHCHQYLNKNYVCLKIGFTQTRRGEGLNQLALFSDGYFSMKKGVWKSKISWLFPIHLKLSGNQKKIWFFTVFWGDLEGAGWFSPPCSQATTRSPALLGLISLSLGI